MIIYFEDAVDGGELYTYNISVFVCCCSDWNSSYSVVETIVILVLISLRLLYLTAKIMTKATMHL